LRFSKFLKKFAKLAYFAPRWISCGGANCGETPQP
jgi:hypothetical protein